MSYEVWGDPPDPEPNPCAMCEEELGSSVDCKLCEEFARSNKAEAALSSLRYSLAHRIRLIRKVRHNPAELDMAIVLLAGLPGVLQPHEVEPAELATAQKALLVFENMHCLYSRQPGCNCLHDNKPHTAIHAETCPYRINFGWAYEVKKPSK